MSIVAEQDKTDMAKVLEDLEATRSRESHELALECAYAIGRRRGFAECGEMTKRIISGEPAAAVLEEDERHG